MTFLTKQLIISIPRQELATNQNPDCITYSSFNTGRPSKSTYNNKLKYGMPRVAAAKPEQRATNRTSTIKKPQPPKTKYVRHAGDAVVEQECVSEEQDENEVSCESGDVCETSDKQNHSLYLIILLSINTHYNWNPSNSESPPPYRHKPGRK